MSEHEAGGRERENPYKRPRDYHDATPRFIETYGNPEVEIVDRPDMSDMVAIAECWDREYDMPIDTGTVFWGHKGEFYSLFHAVMRYAVRHEPELLDRYLDTDSGSDDLRTDGGHLPSDPDRYAYPDPEDDPFACSICGAPLGELKRVEGEEHCDGCQREYGFEEVR